MIPVYDCTTEDGRATGVAEAAEAVRRGEVVVLPTDTVYGVGADAFSPDAVAAVLAAKGRGREMPPPVLVPNPRTLDGLATSVPAYARELVKAFWPGPLTVVLLAQSSLMWDLGDTNGTVALRMPEDDVALALLDAVGPMAVTSANITGQPAATPVTDAAAQLGAALPGVARHLLPARAAPARGAGLRGLPAHLDRGQRVLLLLAASLQLCGLAGGEPGGLRLRGQGRPVHHPPEEARRRGDRAGQLLRLRRPGPRAQARAGAVAAAADPGLRPRQAGRVLRAAAAHPGRGGGDGRRPRRQARRRPRPGHAA